MIHYQFIRRFREYHKQNPDEFYEEIRELI